MHGSRPKQRAGLKPQLSTTKTRTKPSKTPPKSPNTPIHTPKRTNFTQLNNSPPLPTYPSDEISPQLVQGVNSTKIPPSIFNTTPPGLNIPHINSHKRNTQKRCLTPSTLLPTFLKTIPHVHNNALQLGTLFRPSRPLHYDIYSFLENDNSPIRNVALNNENSFDTQNKAQVLEDPTSFAPLTGDYLDDNDNYLGASIDDHFLVKKVAFAPINIVSEEPSFLSIFETFSKHEMESFSQIYTDFQKDLKNLQAFEEESRQHSFKQKYGNSDYFDSSLQSHFLENGSDYLNCDSDFESPIKITSEVNTGPIAPPLRVKLPQDLGQNHNYSFEEQVSAYLHATNMELNIEEFSVNKNSNNFIKIPHYHPAHIKFMKNRQKIFLPEIPISIQHTLLSRGSHDLVKFPEIPAYPTTSIVDVVKIRSQVFPQRDLKSHLKVLLSLLETKSADNNNTNETEIDHEGVFSFLSQLAQSKHPELPNLIAILIEHVALSTPTFIASQTVLDPTDASPHRNNRSEHHNNQNSSSLPTLHKKAQTAATDHLHITTYLQQSRSSFDFINLCLALLRKSSFLPTTNLLNAILKITVTLTDSTQTELNNILLMFNKVDSRINHVTCQLIGFFFHSRQQPHGVINFANSLLSQGHTGFDKVFARYLLWAHLEMKKYEQAMGLMFKLYEDEGKRAKLLENSSLFYLFFQRTITSNNVIRKDYEEHVNIINSIDIGSNHSQIGDCNNNHSPSELKPHPNTPLAPQNLDNIPTIVDISSYFTPIAPNSATMTLFAAHLRDRQFFLSANLSLLTKKATYFHSLLTHPQLSSDFSPLVSHLYSTAQKEHSKIITELMYLSSLQVFFVKESSRLDVVLSKEHRSLLGDAFRNSRIVGNQHLVELVEFFTEEYVKLLEKHDKTDKKLLGGDYHSHSNDGSADLLKYKLSKVFRLRQDIKSLAEIGVMEQTPHFPSLEQIQNMVNYGREVENDDLVVPQAQLHQTGSSLPAEDQINEPFVQNKSTRSMKHLRLGYSGLHGGILGVRKVNNPVGYELFDLSTQKGVELRENHIRESFVIIDKFNDPQISQGISIGSLKGPFEKDGDYNQGESNNQHNDTNNKHSAIQNGDLLQHTITKKLKNVLEWESRLDETETAKKESKKSAVNRIENDEIRFVSPLDTDHQNGNDIVPATPSTFLSDRLISMLTAPLTEAAYNEESFINKNFYNRIMSLTVSHLRKQTKPKRNNNREQMLLLPITRGQLAAMQTTSPYFHTLTKSVLPHHLRHLDDIRIQEDDYLQIDHTQSQSAGQKKLHKALQERLKSTQYLHQMSQLNANERASLLAVTIIDLLHRNTDVYPNNTILPYHHPSKITTKTIKMSELFTETRAEGKKTITGPVRDRTTLGRLSNLFKIGLNCLQEEELTPKEDIDDGDYIVDLDSNLSKIKNAGEEGPSDLIDVSNPHALWDLFQGLTFQKPFFDSDVLDARYTRVNDNYNTLPASKKPLTLNTELSRELDQINAENLLAPITIANNDYIFSFGFPPLENDVIQAFRLFTYHAKQSLLAQKTILNENLSLTRSIQQVEFDRLILRYGTKVQQQRYRNYLDIIGGVLPDVNTDTDNGIIDDVKDTNDLTPNLGGEDDDNDNDDNDDDGLNEDDKHLFNQSSGDKTQKEPLQPQEYLLDPIAVQYGVYDACSQMLSSLSILTGGFLLPTSFIYTPSGPHNSPNQPSPSKHTPMTTLPTSTIEFDLHIRAGSTYHNVSHLSLTELKQTFHGLYSLLDPQYDTVERNLREFYMVIGISPKLIYTFLNTMTGIQHSVNSTAHKLQHSEKFSKDVSQLARLKLKDASLMESIRNKLPNTGKYPTTPPTETQQITHTDEYTDGKSIKGFIPSNLHEELLLGMVLALNKRNDYRRQGAAIPPAISKEIFEFQKQLDAFHRNNIDQAEANENSSNIPALKKNKSLLINFDDGESFLQDDDIGDVVNVKGKKTAYLSESETPFPQDGHLSNQAQHTSNLLSQGNLYHQSDYPYLPQFSKDQLEISQPVSTSTKHTTRFSVPHLFSHHLISQFAKIHSAFLEFSDEIIGVAREEDRVEREFQNYQNQNEEHLIKPELPITLLRGDQINRPRKDLDEMNHPDALVRRPEPNGQTDQVTTSSASAPYLRLLSRIQTSQSLDGSLVKLAQLGDVVLQTDPDQTQATSLLARSLADSLTLQPSYSPTLTSISSQMSNIVELYSDVLIETAASKVYSASSRFSLRSYHFVSLYLNMLRSIHDTTSSSLLTGITFSKYRLPIQVNVQANTGANNLKTKNLKTQNIPIFINYSLSVSDQYDITQLSARPELHATADHLIENVVDIELTDSSNDDLSPPTQRYTYVPYSVSQKGSKYSKRKPLEATGVKTKLMFPTILAQLQTLIPKGAQLPELQSTVSFSNLQHLQTPPQSTHPLVPKHQFALKHRSSQQLDSCTPQVIIFNPQPVAPYSLYQAEPPNQLLSTSSNLDYPDLGPLETIFSTLLLQHGTPDGHHQAHAIVDFITSLLITKPGQSTHGGTIDSNSRNVKDHKNKQTEISHLILHNSTILETIIEKYSEAGYHSVAIELVHYLCQIVGTEALLTPTFFSLYADLVLKHALSSIDITAMEHLKPNRYDPQSITPETEIDEISFITPPKKKDKSYSGSSAEIAARRVNKYHYPRVNEKMDQDPNVNAVCYNPDDDKKAQSRDGKKLKTSRSKPKLDSNRHELFNPDKKLHDDVHGGKFFKQLSPEEAQNRKEVLHDVYRAAEEQLRLSNEQHVLRCELNKAWMKYKKSNLEYVAPVDFQVNRVLRRYQRHYLFFDPNESNDETHVGNDQNLSPSPSTSKQTYLNLLDTAIPTPTIQDTVFSALSILNSYITLCEKRMQVPKDQDVSKILSAAARVQLDEFALTILARISPAIMPPTGNINSGTTVGGFVTTFGVTQTPNNPSQNESSFTFGKKSPERNVNGSSEETMRSSAVQFYEYIDESVPPQNYISFQHSWFETIHHLLLANSSDGTLSTSFIQRAPSFNRHLLKILEQQIGFVGTNKSTIQQYHLLHDIMVIQPYLAQSASKEDLRKKHTLYNHASSSPGPIPERHVTNSKLPEPTSFTNQNTPHMISRLDLSNSQHHYYVWLWKNTLFKSSRLLSPAISSLRDRFWVSIARSSLPDEYVKFYDIDRLAYMDYSNGLVGETSILRLPGISLQNHENSNHGMLPEVHELPESPVDWYAQYECPESGKQSSTFGAKLNPKRTAKQSKTQDEIDREAELKFRTSELEEMMGIPFSDLPLGKKSVGSAIKPFQALADAKGENDSQHVDIAPATFNSDIISSEEQQSAITLLRRIVDCLGSGQIVTQPDKGTFAYSKKALALWSAATIDYYQKVAVDLIDHYNTTPDNGLGDHNHERFNYFSNNPTNKGKFLFGAFGSMIDEPTGPLLPIEQFSQAPDRNYARTALAKNNMPEKSTKPGAELQSNLKQFPPVEFSPEQLSTGKTKLNQLDAYPPPNVLPSFKSVSKSAWKRGKLDTEVHGLFNAEIPAISLTKQSCQDFHQTEASKRNPPHNKKSKQSKQSSNNNYPQPNKNKTSSGGLTKSQKYGLPIDLIRDIQFGGSPDPERAKIFAQHPKPPSIFATPVDFFTLKSSTLNPSDFSLNLPSFLDNGIDTTRIDLLCRLLQMVKDPKLISFQIMRRSLRTANNTIQEILAIVHQANAFDFNPVTRLPKFSPPEVVLAYFSFHFDLFKKVESVLGRTKNWISTLHENLESAGLLPPVIGQDGVIDLNVIRAIRIRQYQFEICLQNRTEIVKEPEFLPFYDQNSLLTDKSPIFNSNSSNPSPGQAIPDIYSDEFYRNQTFLQHRLDLSALNESTSGPQHGFAPPTKKSPTSDDGNIPLGSPHGSTPNHPTHPHSSLLGLPPARHLTVHNSGELSQLFTAFHLTSYRDWMLNNGLGQLGTGTNSLLAPGRGHNSMNPNNYNSPNHQNYENDDNDYIRSDNNNLYPHYDLNQPPIFSHKDALESPLLTRPVSYRMLKSLSISDLDVLRAVLTYYRRRYDEYPELGQVLINTELLQDNQSGIETNSFPPSDGNFIKKEQETKQVLTRSQAIYIQEQFVKLHMLSRLLGAKLRRAQQPYKVSTGVDFKNSNNIFTKRFANALTDAKFESYGENLRDGFLKTSAEFFKYFR